MGEEEEEDVREKGTQKGGRRARMERGKKKHTGLRARKQVLLAAAFQLLTH